MPETASDLFVERLMEWGVDTVFGLPGDGINGFMEALRTRHDRLRYVHVRHEEVGAMAAVGYARLTGKLGVCFATSGPGAIHLANGLLDARLEGVPLLAITGMTYPDLIGTHYLQDYDTGSTTAASPRTRRSCSATGWPTPRVTWWPATSAPTR